MKTWLLTILLLFTHLGHAKAAVAPQVTLNWTQSTSPNLADNCVYRGAVTGGPYTQLACSAAPIVTYPDTTVIRGNTYYYVVTAVNTSGIESGYSNEIKVVVPSVTPPTNLTFTVQ